jgi:hypothetical protein
MKEYTIGTIAVFDITWLSQTSEEATVTGTPTITIRKYDPATNTWSNIVTAANMTVDTGSAWFYEYDTTGQTAEYDYRTTYNAVVETLNVEATEDFRLITTSASQEDVRQLRFGNERMDFAVATVVDVTRGVTIGMLDHITIYTKTDAAADWTSPTSTKVLYMWYDSSGNCIAKKEDG